MVGGRESPGMREVAKSRPARELGTASVPEGWWHLVAGGDEDSPEFAAGGRSPASQDTTGLKPPHPALPAELFLNWNHTR